MCVCLQKDWLISLITVHLLKQALAQWQRELHANGRDGCECARALALSDLPCAVCIYIEQVVHTEASRSESVSPWFKSSFQVIDGANGVIVGGFFSRAAAVLLSPRTIMHLQGFIYLNCYDNTSFTFSMFAVNTTSPLEILADHQAHKELRNVLLAHQRWEEARCFFSPHFKQLPSRLCCFGL